MVTNSGEGASEVLTLQKKGGGGGAESFSYAEEGRGGVGDTKGLEVVFTREVEVLAILLAGSEQLPPLKSVCVGGSFSLEGGGEWQHVLDPQFSHYVAPPPCN